MEHIQEKDEFCSKSHHFWTAISIIAGALERKVYLRRDVHDYYFPNFYVMLLGKPGMGKSSASKRGVNLILKQIDPLMSFLPEQTTESKLIDTLTKCERIFVSDLNKAAVTHTSAYWFAEEASNCFKEISGDLVSALTNFYDCPVHWRKGLISKPDYFEIKNLCINFIAGCTYEFLGKLVTGEEIMGGFASRLIYVLPDEHMQRKSVWYKPDNLKAGNNVTEMLIHDLRIIHHLVGEYSVDESFREYYYQMFDKSEEVRKRTKSEKLLSLNARKIVNTIKLSMVIAASESNSMVITAKQLERADNIMTEVTKDLPFLLLRHLDDRGQTSNFVKKLIGILDSQPHKIMKKHELTCRALMNGMGQNPWLIHDVYKSMLESRLVRQVNNGSDEQIELLINPNDYL